MRNFMLMLMGLMVPALSTISAQLVSVQYEPLIFKLSFSQAVQRPRFQIMLNNVNEVSYQFISPNVTFTDTYYFKTTSTPPTSSFGLESYELVFNNPLIVGDGNLNIDSFVIIAGKQGFEIQFASVFGILVGIAGYFLSNFTIFGNIVVEFSQIYCIFMFKSQLKPGIYSQLSRILLLVDPKNAANFILNLSLPLFIVLVFGLTGLTMKKWCGKQRSIPVNILYHIFTYNTFINFSLLFSFNFLYNSLYVLANISSLNTTDSKRIACIILSYLNLTTLVFVLYLLFITMNPRWEQSDRSWDEYKKSQTYLTSFKKLHDEITTVEWYHRNMYLINVIKRILYVVLFTTTAQFQYFILLLQFIDLLYVFTLRPFKQQFFYNVAIIFRLMVFFYYSITILINIYYSLGDITINYAYSKIFLTLSGLLFLLIILAMVVIIFFQIYQKCSNLNYHIRLVKEQNQYKLKITARERDDTKTSEDKKRRRKSEISDSTKNLRKSTIIDDNLSIASKKPSTKKSSERKQQTKDAQQAFNCLQRFDANKMNPLLAGFPTTSKSRSRRKSTQAQIQMVEMSSPDNRNRTNTKKTNKSGNSGKEMSRKKRWNQQRVLTSIIDK